MSGKLQLSFFTDRMNELGIDRLELAKRFVAVRYAEGDTTATISNRKNMIYRLMSGESDVDNMRHSTFRALMIALEGDVIAIWQGREVPRVEQIWGTNKLPWKVQNDP